MNGITGIVRSELIKITTTRGLWIMSVVLLALHTLIVQIQLGDYVEAVRSITPDGQINLVGPEPAVPALTLDLTTWPLQTGIFVCVIGAIIAGAEFRPGQLGASVLAVPNRIRLLVGKTLATSAIALGVGIALVLIAAAHMFVAVKDWNPGILWAPEALFGYARFIGFVLAFTLTGFALTLIVRRTLSGIIFCVALIGLTMTQVVAALTPGVDALLPVSAARNLLLGQDPEIFPPVTAEPVHGAIVLAAWAIITLFLAGLLLRQRDAR